MKNKTLTYKILKFFEKLAFAKNNDVLKLVFNGNALSTDDLKKINMFGVSELKRDKDGGVQVKFDDKLAVLDRLYQIASEQTDAQRQMDFMSCFSEQEDDFNEQNGNESETENSGGMVEFEEVS